ncbi:cysteine dioxygenase family protein [Paraburkholderia tropica]|uniref:cysteine dioxygenase family protein n=1 Tax=Paraburkholderia tropica TaxID=92647 RepID=UPI002AB774FB|nr:cysteine dioxygenase [Paraburkholderia tropica]
MSISRLRTFVAEITDIAAASPAEDAILQQVRTPMTRLLAHDDWLPDAFAMPDARSYRQYLLHCDPLERFSIVSFVWGPGQETPIHDHTVWGMIGMLRGSEQSTRYELDGPNGHLIERQTDVLQPGDIDVVSPSIGDLHRVRNSFDDRTSVSIHVYGGNIGRIQRHTFAATGAMKSFTSSYSSNVLPNFWASE